MLNLRLKLMLTKMSTVSWVFERLKFCPGNESSSWKILWSRTSYSWQRIHHCPRLLHGYSRSLEPRYTSNIQGNQWRTASFSHFYSTCKLFGLRNIKSLHALSHLSCLRQEQQPLIEVYESILKYSQCRCHSRKSRDPCRRAPPCGSSSWLHTHLRSFCPLPFFFWKICSKASRTGT